MISLAALEAYTEYARNAQSRGLSIDDIEKAMADQGVDEYSRSLVANQLKAGLSKTKSQSGKDDASSDTATVAQKNLAKRERTVNLVIFVVAIVEPLGVIPQLITIFLHQNASNIAILTWVAFVVFDIAWLWYGLESKSKPLIVSSALYTFLEFLVVIGAIAYGGYW
jgi:uncharacterized protein with PQ loop repeat